VLNVCAQVEDKVDHTLRTKVSDCQSTYSSARVVRGIFLLVKPFEFLDNQIRRGRFCYTLKDGKTQY
jgi:hypothetical protein